MTHGRLRAWKQKNTVCPWRPGRRGRAQSLTVRGKSPQRTPLVGSCLPNQGVSSKQGAPLPRRASTEQTVSSPRQLDSARATSSRVSKARRVEDLAPLTCGDRAARRVARMDFNRFATTRRPPGGGQGLGQASARWVPRDLKLKLPSWLAILDHPKCLWPLCCLRALLPRQAGRLRDERKNIRQGEAPQSRVALRTSSSPNSLNGGIPLCSRELRLCRLQTHGLAPMTAVESHARLLLSLSGWAL